LGFEALDALGFHVPVGKTDATALEEKLGPRISTDPNVIAVHLTHNLSYEWTWKDLPVAQDVRVIRAHEVFSSLITPIYSYPNNLSISDPLEHECIEACKFPLTV
jgi:hypothetical protein